MSNSGTSVARLEGNLVGNDEVGISLMAGEETDAIVELLTAKLGDALKVTDHITHVKLETNAGQIEICFADVAESLGRHFDMGDFQGIFASYYGRPSISDEMIGVYTSMTMGVSDPE